MDVILPVMRANHLWLRRFLLILAFWLPISCLPLISAERDLTFFLISDTHVGMSYKDTAPPVTTTDYEQHINDTLDVIATIPGKSWPETITAKLPDLGPVKTPSGIIVAGDLTDNGKAAQWTAFDRLFPWQELPPKRFTVFAGAGNHDGGTKSGAIRNSLRERNTAMLKAGLMTTLSGDGLHCAWVWQGVHFINANLYFGDDPKAHAGPGSMWAPEKSLSFLKNYLATNAPAPTPVILIQHFDLGNSTWWDQDKRHALYDVIKDYNVVAILHGHTHAITHQLFPCDTDLKAYGSDGPRFDCFSAGAFKHDLKKEQPPHWRHPCECYVFHMSDGQLAAAHYTGANCGWNTDKPAAELTVVKSILPAK